LLKVGIDIGETSVSKYLVHRRKPPSQSWRTFLEIHVEGLVSIDFFTVPTIRFQVLYVFVVLAHERRRIVHFAVRARPTAEWTAHQLREAFPWDSAPRFLLRDRDRIFGHEFNTTGVLGVSRSPDGELSARAFPWWMTIPDNPWLSMARAWHFFFAWVLLINGMVYVAYGAASRHLSRDLAPDRNDWRSIGRSIRDHLRFRHPTGEAAKRYNVLQKLAYLVVIFLLLPLIILMGIAMSPWMNSVLPGWVDLFGGRQAARTLHFVAAWLLVAFVAIHVFEVIVSGLWNHLRSMITGRYRIHAERAS